ncbi:MAG TPA: hypothetical protein VMH41_07250 [Mycobacteriales bacterium]|nr:hypothetical protein [Mycobacteriales bacterium]
MSSRRRAVAIAAAALIAAGSLAQVAGAAGASGAAQAKSAAGAGAVTVSKQITRSDVLPDGKTKTVDKRKVTVSVSATKQLRTLQEINVSWKGAHPSNYVDPDPNSSTAATLEEYPVVVLECRGVDSSKAPAAQRLSPNTCWTQYLSERNATAPGTDYPPWRMDRYAGNLPAFNNVPKPLPTGCSKYALNEADYFQPLDGANGKTYYSGPTVACSKLAPEQGTFTADFPDNTTFGTTGSDGSGLAKFVLWSDETNATLGCSSSVPCSLVVIPIDGMSCDEQARGDLSAQDIANCTYSDDQSGQAENATRELDGDPGNMALESVTGALWWSASNWRNRITVPLSFAKPADYCSVVGSKPAVFVYGSELMTEAAQQWAPAFCTDPKRTPFTQVPQAEPASVNSLSEGNIQAAYDTYPSKPEGKSGHPVVNAPVAVNGFAIATLVDDGDHNEVFDVRLDPRLLAKLLTESYPVLDEVAQDDGSPDGGTTPGPMADNPLNITDDPEFQALNPDIPKASPQPGYLIYYEARAELMALSSNSDIMRALTSYIEADPAARAFINGKPDPWGMVVNPAYKGMKLPVDFWPLKDTFVPTQSYNADKSGCFAQTQFQVPYLPLVAAPVLSLSTAAYDMEFGLPNSTTNCTIATVAAADKISADPRQQPGVRFMLGVVSLSEAKRYDLDTALLETRSSVSPTSKIHGPADGTFVRASTKTMRSAVSALKPDPSMNAWSMDYGKLRSGSSTAHAYPGTMLVSESVPSAGLSSEAASAFAQQLSFAAKAGQTPGNSFGDLPPGYLPMTAANGLGAESAYTARAAQAVSDQQCEIPNINGSGQTRSKWSGCPDPTPTPTQTEPSSQRSTPPVSRTPGPTSTHSDGGTSPQPSSSTSASSPASSPSESASPAAVATPATPVGPLGIAIPIVLLAAVVTAIAVIGPRLVRGWRRTGAKT